MTSPADLTLAQASQALNDKTISSRELTEAVLARANAINNSLNAFLRIDEEHARAQAEVADRERSRGFVRGTLHGVPLALKDMFHRAGTTSSYGTKAEMPVPTCTSTALSRLDAAGAIQIGVLNMTAFAVGPTGHNKITGDCRNPWNTSRITGGSSSGSGSAVAGRAVFGALGSDTAGSVRIPAAICGVTGLKPTYGRISRSGTMGLSFTLDVVGPMARTSEDCAMLMNVIAGPDPADPTTVQSAPPDFLRTIGRSIRSLRVGVALPGTLGLVDPQIEQALFVAQSVFADLGCELVPIHVPDLDVLDAAAGIVLASEGSAQHARFMLEQGETYGKQIRVRLERGFAIPAPKYIDALRYRSVALQTFTASVFSAVDALILPVTAIRTPRIDESDVETGADIDDVVRQLTRFTRPLNYLGLPSLAVPIGFDSDGLPMSMQLVGRSLSEDLLLRLGHAYQTVCQWHLKAPHLPTNERLMA